MPIDALQKDIFSKFQQTAFFDSCLQDWDKFIDEISHLNQFSCLVY